MNLEPRDAFAMGAPMWPLLGVAMILTACDGSSGSAGSGGDEADYVLLDAFEVSETVPCQTTNVAGLPLLGLDYARTLETYLAPGLSSEAIALDYEIVPAARVERVEVVFDYDPRVTGTGGEGPDLVYSDRCLGEIPIADLEGEASEEVVTAMVWAGDAEGLDARQGRITLSTGTSETTVATDDIDDSLGDWYFVFEPASGATRILLTSAEVSGADFTQEGIPDMAGSVALVQAPELGWDAATGTIYAPPAFASTWRERVSGWYGRLRHRGEEAAAHPLEAIIPPGVSVNARLLSGTIDPDFETTSHLVLESVGEAATLEVACEAFPLRFVSAGWVDLEVDDELIEAGETTVVDRECADAGEIVALSLTPHLLAPRSQTIVVSLADEE